MNATGAARSAATNHRADGSAQHDGRPLVLPLLSVRGDVGRVDRERRRGDDGELGELGRQYCVGTCRVDEQVQRQFVLEGLTIKKSTNLRASVSCFVPRNTPANST